MNAFVDDQFQVVRHSLGNDHFKSQVDAMLIGPECEYFAFAVPPLVHLAPTQNRRSQRMPASDRRASWPHHHITILWAETAAITKEGNKMR